MVADMLAAGFWLAAGHKLLRIGLILAGAAVVLKLAHLVINHLFIPRADGKTFYFGEKRIRTLTGLLWSITRYLVYFIALIMILQEFNVDTTSIIAGAGIFGLALGVGAQSLIRDLITGFFIILEDQYSVGDYIACGDMSGTVEEIGFRVTKLRDVGGMLHIIPHGLITRVTNYTRGPMQAIVDVPVGYEADLTRALALLDQACQDVAAVMPEMLDGQPKVLGIVDFRPGEMVVRLAASTVPLQQQKVETALRQRAKLLFDAAGIPMTVPVVKVTAGRRDDDDGGTV